MSPAAAFALGCVTGIVLMAAVYSILNWHERRTDPYAAAATKEHP